MNFSTKIDLKGFDKGLSKVDSGFETLKSSIKGLIAAVTKTDQLAVHVDTSEAETKTEQLKDSLNSVFPAEETINIDTTKAEKKAKKLDNEIEKLERRIEKLSTADASLIGDDGEYISAAAGAKDAKRLDALEAAKEKLAELQELAREQELDILFDVNSDEAVSEIAQVENAASEAVLEFGENGAVIKIVPDAEETDRSVAAVQKAWDFLTESSKKTSERIRSNFKKSNESIQDSAEDLGDKIRKITDSSAKAVTDRLEDIQSKIKGAASVLGLAIGFGELIRFAKQSVESAAEVNAQVSQIEQTFGSLEDAARGAMHRVADASGILETRLQSVGTGIYAFAKTSGMDSVQALSMMEDALTVAADSAAYYDRSLEETSATLQSFLKGNYANDAALGLSATETTRNAAAMKLYGKSFQQLSEAQKQLTLLQMVKDANALSGATGQAARESEGWENVLGNLKEAWRQLMAAIGQPALRLAVDGVKLMTNAITLLTEKAQIAVNTLNRLFGWEQTNAASVSSAIAQSTSEQEALTDAVEETAKAQENMLAGFDKITKLGGEESKSSQSASEITPTVSTDALIPTVEQAAEESVRVFDDVFEITAPIQEAWDEYGDSIEKHLVTNFETIRSAVMSCADTTKDWLKELDYKPLAKSVDGVLAALEPFTRRIGEGIEWTWKNVLLPLGKWTLEDALPASLDVLSGALDALDGILEALKPYGMWLWEEFISPIAAWTGEIIVSGLWGLADVLHNIGDWIRENPDASAAIVGLSAAFLGLYAVLAGGMVGTAITGIAGFAASLGALNVTVGVIVAGIAAWVYVITELHNNWDDIMDVFEDSGGVFGFLAGWIEYVREDVEEFFDFSSFGHEWRMFWEAVGEAVYDGIHFVTGLFENGKQKFTESLDKMKWWFGITKNYIKEQIEKVPAFFKEKFDTAYAKVTGALSPVISFFDRLAGKIKEPFSGIASWFHDVFSEAWQRVLDVFSSGGSVFDGIQAGISSVFSSVVNSLIDGINNTLSVPFGTINSALSTIRNWGIWLPWAGDWQPFQWLPEVTIPKIPRLAQGTVVPANYGEFLAVLGDNKREAEVVSPISSMKQAFREVMQEFASDDDGRPVDIYLDSKLFYKLMIKQNNKSIRMTGKNPLNPKGATT